MFIGNAVFWPGLSILQSSAVLFSLSIISYSSPSRSFVFLRTPCPARVLPITYAIVDYHRAVDDVSAGNTAQAASPVGPVFLPGLSTLPFRHLFSTCPRSLALHFVLITALQSSFPMFLRQLTNQPISTAPSSDLPMEAATELATAHSITLRLAPPFLASLALSTCSALVGRFHLRRVRVFRCLMFLLHDVRTSARAFSEMPAGHWIRDIIIYTPTNQL